mmetsp:Transcript_91803/g.259853  ORF Transcript_91803/g.259853 Transcript_91803/m.259853 type:complete len:265 (+) Transcript_91803:65-859(+)
MQVIQAIQSASSDAVDSSQWAWNAATSYFQKPQKPHSSKKHKKQLLQQQQPLQQQQRPQQLQQQQQRRRRQEQDPDFWEHLQALPSYTVQGLEETASYLNVLVGSSGRRRGPAATAEQREEAVHLIREFCETYSEEQVAPSDEELEDFWGRCSLLYAQVLHPAPLANALRKQLAAAGAPGSTGPAPAWQPRLRALYVMEHLHRKGAVGEVIISKLMSRNAGVVVHLAQVPECKEKATELLRELKYSPEQTEASAEATPTAYGGA